MPVDFTGRPVNLEAFRKLADKHEMWIIEDAAHSPGGFFTDSNNKPQNCGNGQFADLAIFSFHPVKHIASGEGGMITTNDKNLYRLLCFYRSHGITNTGSELKGPVEQAFGGSIPENYPQNTLCGIWKCKNLVLL